MPSKKYLVSPRQYPLVITTGRILPGATVGVNYHQAFNAVGGSGGYTWAVLAQSGTNTWNIFPNGEITGTPINGFEVDNFTIRVTDSVGNIAIGQFSISVSPNPAAGVVFHPGHVYAPAPPASTSLVGWSGALCPNRTAVQNEINALPDQIRVLQLRLSWSLLEDTQGVYDGFNRGGVANGGGSATSPEAGGFTYVSDILTMCKNKMLERQSRSISVANSYLGLRITLEPDGGSDPGGAVSNTHRLMPAYVKSLANDPVSGVPPVWDSSVNAGHGLTTNGWVGLWYSKNIANALIAMEAAYFDHFDSDPNFEMMTLCRGETDPSISYQYSPGWVSNSWFSTNWRNAWITMLNGVAPHAHKTPLHVMANWIGGYDSVNAQMYFVPLLDAMKTQAQAGHPICVGAPDCYSYRTSGAAGSVWVHQNDFLMSYNGYISTDGGVTWTQTAHNYAVENLFGILQECQDPECGGKENPRPQGTAVYLPGGWVPGATTSAIYNNCVYEGQHYVTWWFKEYVVDGTIKQLYWDNTQASFTGETQGHFALDIKGFVTGTGPGAPTPTPLGPPLNQTNPVGWTRG